MRDIIVSQSYWTAEQITDIYSSYAPTLPKIIFPSDPQFAETALVTHTFGGVVHSFTGDPGEMVDLSLGVPAGGNSLGEDWGR